MFLKIANHVGFTKNKPLKKVNLQLTITVAHILTCFIILELLVLNISFFQSLSDLRTKSSDSNAQVDALNAGLKAKADELETAKESIVGLKNDLSQLKGKYRCNKEFSFFF